MYLLQHRVDTVSFKITKMLLNTNLQASQMIHLTSPMSCNLYTTAITTQLGWKFRNIETYCNNQ